LNRFYQASTSDIKETNKEHTLNLIIKEKTFDSSSILTDAAQSQYHMNEQLYTDYIQEVAVSYLAYAAGVFVYWF
jgi:hypothetical protein